MAFRPFSDRHKLEELKEKETVNRYQQANVGTPFHGQSVMSLCSISVSISSTALSTNSEYNHFDSFSIVPGNVLHELAGAEIENRSCRLIIFMNMYNPRIDNSFSQKFDSVMLAC